MIRFKVQEARYKDKREKPVSQRAGTDLKSVSVYTIRDSGLRHATANILFLIKGIEYITFKIRGIHTACPT